jgi:hypothetical protein
MTQFIEPNKKSDLTAPKVLQWLQSFPSGILNGFEVSPGASGFLLNIQSGRVCIRGTHVYDDLTRLDWAGLSPGGGDQHFIVQATYTATDTFPPAPMVIGVKATTPPTVPSVDVDSVKLADIFVPAGAVDISDCRIINTPRLPARGNDDGDVLIDRLVNSNMNVIVHGGGVFSYDAGTETLSWSDAVDLVAVTVTNKEKFFTVPLASARIDAGTLGPAPAVGPNSILFAVFDRRIQNDPGSPVALDMHVLNLDDPDPVESALFFNPATREQIVFIATVLGGLLKFRGGVGKTLPLPDGDIRKFLRNSPDGEHYWSLITADLIVSILSISAFSATTATVEIGTEVTAPAFTAGYVQGPPTSAVLTDGEGTPAKDVSGTPTGFASDGVFQKSSDVANGQALFTLTADAGDTPATRNTNINWYRRVYWGFEPVDPGAYDNEFLKTTVGGGGSPTTRSSLRAGKAFSFSLPIPGAPSYVFFAYPERHGDLSAILDNNNGLPALGAFAKVGTAAAITTENDEAVAETYNVYRSNEQQTGAVNLTVS